MIVQKSTSKNVKAMKDRKRLRNCHRMEAIKGVMTKCKVGSRSGDWNRIRTLVEIPEE